MDVIMASYFGVAFRHSSMRASMSCAIVLGTSPTKKWVGEFCIANPEVLKVIQNNKVM